MTDSDYTAGMPAAGSLVDRIANLAVTVVPLALIAVAIWQSWGGLLVWQDILIFFATLIPFGFGITVGFHRLFTHRSFKTSRPMRFLWAVLGSMALEGPVIEWVAYHRRHHRFSDCEGDPHSPHVGHGSGFLGAVRGLFHAHVGWVLFSDEAAEEERYAPDLIADPVVLFVDRTFVLWAVAGLALPFGLGVALTFPVLSAAAVAGLPAERFAAGGALNQTARQLGAVLGVAILVAILGTPATPAAAVDAFHRAWVFAAAASLVSAGISAFQRAE